VDIPNVDVKLFGRLVKAVCIDGIVMFDRDSFSGAVGVARAKRIYGEMGELFSFLGPDGVDELVASGKEHLLCETILCDKSASGELREYATAWVSAFELLRGQRDAS
jgi:hypothetical protein